MVISGHQGCVVLPTRCALENAAFQAGKAPSQIRQPTPPFSRLFLQGRVFLEDAHATIELDLSAAQLTAGKRMRVHTEPCLTPLSTTIPPCLCPYPTALALTQQPIPSGFFTYNSIVLAEGEVLSSGRFKVSQLGFPPPEERAISIAALDTVDPLRPLPVGVSAQSAMVSGQPIKPRPLLFLSCSWLPHRIEQLGRQLKGNPWRPGFNISFDTLLPYL